ncbi:MAG TPA: MBL fold metallo-hydrolase [Labilithrix sp.]|nr:MBL fold metallo-hydrolase [Labilithrix sp.]
MRVFVLGSGSSGNALLIESCGTRVLVEAGIGPKVAASRLAELGLALRPGELHGIVATHEHGDHFGHAEKLASAFGAPLFLHAGIAAPAGRHRAVRSTVEEGPASSPIEVQRYEIGRAFHVGALAISTVHVPHDAAQVAVRVDDGTRALGIATDVGRVTPGLVALMAQCDAALVEANHCSEMLAFSEYPDVVKRRIGGGWGHLSNAQTADLAGRLVGSRLARLWLGHLSRSNNTPARALEVVASRATRIEVAVLPAASPVALDVRSTKPYQLGLPF